MTSEGPDMLAEDLMMLLHNPATGRLLVPPGKADVAIGGALLAELMERHSIELTEPHRVTKHRTVSVIDPTPTGDDILDEVLQRIPACRSARAHVVVSKITNGVRSRLMERLTEQGALKPEQARLVGIIPAAAWPAAHTSHIDELRRGLHHVLAGDRSPTRQEAAIIALLSAIRGTAKVLGDAELGRRELQRRAKATAEGDAAGEAVRQALAAAAF